MGRDEILRQLTQAHNAAAQINVRGDDAIRMAQVLSMLRGLIAELMAEGNSDDRQ